MAIANPIRAASRSSSRKVGVADLARRSLYRHAVAIGFVAKLTAPNSDQPSRRTGQQTESNREQRIDDYPAPVFLRISHSRIVAPSS